MSSDGPATPLFILAAPRSLSSVAAAMLGQHPELYAAPELHLFDDESMASWWGTNSHATFDRADGVLRAVAEICFGEQTEATVRRAKAWLHLRSSVTTGDVFQELALAVRPRILVDKSPNLVYRQETVQRALRFFPDARFVHLVRHPRAYCASVLAYLEKLSQPEYQRPGAGATAGEPPQWIASLASYPYVGPESAVAPNAAHADELPPMRDPQGSWYALNANAATFLAALPDDQWTVLRGEDLLADPIGTMTRLAGWLGLRTDQSAVAGVVHPERSRFACFGPPGARLGNDISFLEQPVLRPARAEPQELAGALPWRDDGRGFLPEVVELAWRFGYR